MSDGKSHNSQDLAIQNIMRMKDGRDFIFGFLQSCNVFNSTFDADSMKNSYNSGNRDAGLRLDQLVKEAATPDYLKMIEENINE